MKRLMMTTAALLALMTCGVAQRTFTVGKNSSAQYSEIHAALRVAKAGDTILVGSGTYASFGTSVGVRILAHYGAICHGTVSVTNVPRGQVFALQGLTITWNNKKAPLTVRDCKGHVYFDRVLVDTREIETLITRCADVRFTHVGFEQGVIMSDSTVTLDACWISPRYLGLIPVKKVWHGIRTKNCVLAIAQSIVTGSTLKTFGTSRSAILSDNSEIFVVGASFLNAGGDKHRGYTTNVVEGTGSITYGPDAIFYPTRNGVPIRGLRTSVVALPALRTNAATIDRTHYVELTAQKGDAAVVLLGAPRVPEARRFLSGYVAHTAQFPVFVTTMPKKAVAFALPVPKNRGLLGIVLTWQAIVGNKVGFSLSNPSTRVVTDR